VLVCIGHLKVQNREICLVLPVYNGGSWDTIACDDVNINDTKYSVSKNPSTGLYYRLHLLNVGVSDVNMYICEGNVNGGIHYF
jgi:hypothetical protein